MKKQMESLKALRTSRGYELASLRQKRNRTAEAIRATFELIPGGQA